MRGDETRSIEGAAVRVTTAARTVADRFKYRNKIGLDVARPKRAVAEHAGHAGEAVVRVGQSHDLRNQSEKDAGADVHETSTTGLGVGVLVFHDLNPRLLLELKANRYELEGGDRSSRLSRR